jgi:hypothetical protein
VNRIADARLVAGLPDPRQQTVILIRLDPRDRLVRPHAAGDDQVAPASGQSMRLNLDSRLGGSSRSPSSLGIPGPLPRLRTPARLRRRRPLLIAAHQLIRHRQPERSEQRLERRPLLSRRAEQRRRPRLASVTGNHKRRGGKLGVDPLDQVGPAGGESG